MTNYLESEIRPEIARLLRNRPGLRIAEIATALQTTMQADDVDLTPYPDRPAHEPRFHQKVRNTLRECRQLITNGWVEYEGEVGDRTYSLTEAGGQALDAQQL